MSPLIHPISRYINASLWSVYLVLGVPNGLYAEIKTPDISSSASSNYFIQDSGPPPGFEHIDPNAPQTTMVSVYYGNTLIVNTLATFTPSNISFANPDEIIQAFSGLKNKALIKAALSQSLPNHTDLICPHSYYGKACAVLQPKVASVIFDPNNYKAYLFLNPDFIEPTKISSQILPHSSAGFSAMSNNTVIMTRNAFDTYALNTQNILGDGNGYLSGQAYYTHQNLSSAQDLLSIPELAAYFYNHDNRYSAGILPTSGSGLFIQTVTMMGFKFQNQQSPSGQNGMNPGSPVVIYLPIPAQVQVYKNNQLIYANNFPAGKQSLDTSSFPVGAYDLNIQITDALQQTRQEQQFFVKQFNNLDLNSTRYNLSLGEIEKTDPSIDRNEFSTFTTQFPQASHQQVFAMDRSQLLNQSIEWDEHLISNTQRAFLDSEFLYFGNNYQITPGFLVSTDSQYGFGSTATYQTNLAYFNFSGARILGSDHILDNTNDTSFLPLTTSKYYLSANTQFNIKQERFSVLGSWQKNVLSGYNQTSSFTWTHPLVKSKSTNTDLSLSLSHTLNDSEITLGIQFNFTTQYFDGNADMGYQNTQGHSKNNALTTQGDLRKYYQLGLNKTLNWDLSSNSDGQSESYGGSVDYSSMPVRARASYLHTLMLTGQQDPQDIYTLEMDSSLVYSGGALGLGYSENKDAGILVDIKSPTPGSTEIRSNDQLIAVVPNNYATPIFLSPYKTYNITINPESHDTQYGYDTQPKTVTLYEGNLQKLTWTLERQIILFTQITDPHGKPIPALLLQAKNNYDMTDNSGYLQTDIPEATQTLSFINQAGLTCEVNLPKKLPINHGLAVLTTPLVCDLKTDLKSDLKK